MTIDPAFFISMCGVPASELVEVVVELLGAHVHDVIGHGAELVHRSLFKFETGTRGQGSVPHLFSRQYTRIDKRAGVIP